jgi:hypothetical protein
MNFLATRDSDDESNRSDCQRGFDQQYFYPLGGEPG